MSCPDNRATVLGLVAGIAPASIVDIGCGAGDYGVYLRSLFPHLRLIGIEAYEDCRNQQWDRYDRVIIADVRGIEIPTADCYLLVDVIEHMSREDGLALLGRLDGPVVVVTPRCWPQDADENPYQAHVSTWRERDFHFSADRSDERFVIGLHE